MIEKAPTLAVVVSVAAVPVFLACYALAYRPTTYPADTQVVNLTGVARRGIWTLERVDNLNYWWKHFEPATIHLPLEGHAILRLHSADVVHQFYVPALNVGPCDVEPGHVTEVPVYAEREGVFQYYCTSLCGECHFYMTGWIVVTAPGRTPVEPEPISCPLCIPTVAPPSDDDVVVQGEYLYRRMACNACHGPEGRGGVKNYNYLNDAIVDHVGMAERLFLRDPESAAAVLDWIEARTASPAAAEPDFPGRGIVLARLEAAVTLIREGKNAARADPAGPEPPLQMPAWQSKLSDSEMHNVMAYLISLHSWEDMDEE